jgi:hypothetical protein
MRRLIALLLGAGLCAPALAQQVSDPVSSTAPAVIKKVTPSIAADTAMLTTANTTDFTAINIFEGALAVPPGAGGKNLDGTRGVAFAPAATTVNLVSGLAAYVLSDAVTAGTGFPATVSLFGAGVARGNGTHVWGVNTLLSDTMTGAVSAGTGKVLMNEFDINVSSPSTQVIGLQLAGGSKAQPAAAYGVVLQPIDVGVALLGGKIARGDPKDAGSVAKWSAFLQANPGSTNIFAGLSPKNATGNNIKSQDIVMGFYGPTGTYGSLIQTASEAGGLELFSASPNARALTLLGGPSRISMPDASGVGINGRTVVFASGTLFSAGSDAGHSVQNYSNASAATTIFGASIKLSTLPASAGAGGMYVCVDSAGALYKKASCP